MMLSIEAHVWAGKGNEFGGYNKYCSHSGLGFKEFLESSCCLVCFVHLVPILKKRFVEMSAILEAHLMCFLNDYLVVTPRLRFCWACSYCCCISPVRTPLSLCFGFIFVFMFSLWKPCGYLLSDFAVADAMKIVPYLLCEVWIVE